MLIGLEILALLNSKINVLKLIIDQSCINNSFRQLIEQIILSLRVAHLSCHLYEMNSMIQVKLVILFLSILCKQENKKDKYNFLINVYIELVTSFFKVSIGISNIDQS